MSSKLSKMLRFIFIFFVFFILASLANSKETVLTCISKCPGNFKDCVEATRSEIKKGFKKEKDINYFLGEQLNTYTITPDKRLYWSVSGRALGKPQILLFENDKFYIFVSSAAFKEKTSLGAYAEFYTIIDRINLKLVKREIFLNEIKTIVWSDEQLVDFAYNSIDRYIKYPYDEKVNGKTCELKNLYPKF